MTKKHIKDPGSAITHFIGMLMAIFAAVPLLIKAAHEPGHLYLTALTIYAASLILLYAASTTYHTVDISEKVNTILKKIDHMMISVLIAGTYTPICLLVLDRKTGIPLLLLVWGIAIAGILGLLSEMVFIRIVYRHGVDLCSRIHSDSEHTVSGCIRMASGRRYHLHDRRYHLCTKTPDLQ